MADGSTKPIEDVKPGDKVKATDPETGETQVETVAATIEGDGIKHLVKITINTDGEQGSDTAEVIATDGHPFWVPELGEWINATDLRTGQWLQTSAGTHLQITAIERWTTPRATVHNLTIANTHTYYVVAGDTPVLVHNCVTVSDGALDHAWDSHKQGGSYHKQGKTENVLSADVADKEALRGLIQRAIDNGTRIERSAGDPRGGYYITHAFDDLEIGHMGQNGLKLFIDEFHNFKSLAPVFLY